MFVTERFVLPEGVKEELRAMTPDFGFGQFSEMVFFRTYSRAKSAGNMEDWSDVVIRSVEGTFSIRKDWYIKTGIKWDDDFWDTYSRGFAISLFKMHWIPPGRGLWMMGTDFIYERGSMALNNCGAITVEDNIGECCNWIADALMLGVGVGFEPVRNDDFETYYPIGEYSYVVEDSREGWANSIQAAIDCYCSPNLEKPIFDYSQVRKVGLPIVGFGGLSSGPEPLMLLHQRIDMFFEMYSEHNWYNTVLLKADIINCIGACVIAGNVRRSAEICIGSINDETFLDLKNYIKYPYRQAWGWCSNNSATLDLDSDYEQLGEIAKRVISNAEPGIINRHNMQFGRVGKSMENIKPDRAKLFNPCAEQPLSSHELCTLVETLPTKCETVDEWYKSLEYATVYASTVTLLPTHRHETNSVMLKNRRIGVGIIDFSGWKHELGLNQVIKHLRKGYERVRSVNRWCADEAGVPESIRVTTVKPSGSVSKLAGKTPGLGHPSFHYTLRRVRVADNSPIVALLKEAKVPYEQDVVSAGTLVFEFPILQGPAKPAAEVSLWEQANNLMVMQSEWSDNAVSNTLTFIPKWEMVFSSQIDILDDITISTWTQITRVSINSMLLKNNYIETTKHRLEIKEQWGNKVLEIYKYNEHHEEGDIESVLASCAPRIKSLSLLPQMSAGCYKQIPEEGITKEEYDQRLSRIKKIDWTKLRHNMAEPDKYCTGDACELPKRT